MPVGELAQHTPQTTIQRAMMNEVQQKERVSYVQFNEAHPNFNAYCVIGGLDFEGENYSSLRLFDSKELSRQYAEELLNNYDYSRRFIISNDGTVWKMPGSRDTFQMVDGNVEVKTY